MLHALCAAVLHALHCLLSLCAHTDQCHSVLCRGREAASCAKVLEKAIKTATKTGTPQRRVALALVEHLQGDTLAYGYTRADCGCHLVANHVHDELYNDPERKAQLRAYYDTWRNEHASCVDKGKCPLRLYHQFAVQMEGEGARFKKAQALAAAAQGPAAAAAADAELIESDTEPSQSDMSD